MPVQVAYSIRDHETKSRETNSLLTAMDELGSSHGLIITYNEEEKIKSGKSSITVIPAWKWLLETGADEQHFTPNARSKPR